MNTVLPIACFAAVLALLPACATPPPTTPESPEAMPDERPAAPQFVAESEDAISVEDVLSRLSRDGWTTAHKRVTEDAEPASTSFLVKTYPTVEPTALVDVKTFSELEAARDLFAQLSKSSYRSARRGRTVITVFCSGDTPPDLEDCDRVLPSALNGDGDR